MAFIVNPSEEAQLRLGIAACHALVLFCRQARDRRQHVLELEVVHLHAVIEVELNALLGQGQQGLLLPGLASCRCRPSSG